MEKDSIQELIDDYLNNSLSDTDRRIVKHMKRTDPKFTEDIIFVQQLNKALQQLELHEKLKYLQHLEKIYSTSPNQQVRKKESLIKLIQKYINQSKFIIIVLLQHFSLNKINS